MVLSLRNLKGKYDTRAKYFSQRAKRTRDTAPNMIMQTGPASAQPLGNDDARLKGRRIKAKPAMVKNIPTTVSKEESVSKFDN